MKTLEKKVLVKEENLSIAEINNIIEMCHKLYKPDNIYIFMDSLNFEDYYHTKVYVSIMGIPE